MSLSNACRSYSRSPLWPFALPLLIAGCLLAEEAEPPFIFEPEVKVPMRDGARLTANVYRPRAEGRFPVILERTPYGRPDGKWDEARRYVAAGYAMVVEDCRGRGKSEGVWDPFRYDVEDGFDTQEWTGRQPWCNGQIGTAGGSYVGWTQWAAWRWTPRSCRRPTGICRCCPSAISSTRKLAISMTG